MSSPFANLPEGERLQQIAELLAAGALRYLRRQGGTVRSVADVPPKQEIWDMVDDDLEKKILRFLQQRVSAEPAQIRTALGLTEVTLGRKLARLRESGLICVTGKTRSARYELAPEVGRN